MKQNQYNNKNEIVLLSLLFIPILILQWMNLIKIELQNVLNSWNNGEFEWVVWERKRRRKVIESVHVISQEREAEMCVLSMRKTESSKTWGVFGTWISKEGMENEIKKCASL